MLPHPPAHVDSLDEFRHSLVQEEFRRRHVHFFCLDFTQRFNQRRWRALEEEKETDLLQ
jgi:hypothetical protein